MTVPKPWPRAKRIRDIIHSRSYQLATCRPSHNSASFALQQRLLHVSKFARASQLPYLSLIFMFIILIRTGVGHQYCLWQVSPHAVMITTPRKRPRSAWTSPSGHYARAHTSVTVIQPYAWVWALQDHLLRLETQTIQLALARHRFTILTRKLAR